MPGRSAKQAPRRRRRIRKLRLYSLLAVLGSLTFASFTFGIVAAIAGEVPSLDPARQKGQVNGYVYAADGRTVLAVLRGSENRVLLEYDEIDPHVKAAIVAIEDRRFWEHRGVDVRGIARALWADIRQQRVVQGGSTITQQFVKNAYVENQRTFGRKVREAALAWQLEQQWDSKPRILTAYLNTIYFANGAYGVQQAAKIYFGHGAEDLSIAESALLAGIPADPSSYDPVANPDAARTRREQVLDAMLELGYINRTERARASRAPLPRPEDVRQPGTQGQFAPYFANYVKDQLVRSLGERKVYGGGRRVRTTIDLGVQHLARAAISKWLRDEDGPSAALVAIDPANGNVLAMIGGNNFRESQFNLAVQGRRQPGSTFKPFVLASALEQGIAPATTLVSQEVEISLGDRLWPVSNYEESYLGPIDLETATIHSDNAVYAQLTQLVGPGAVVRTARRLGIRSPLRPYFSVGLGSQAVNPLELARAFSAFANGGLRIDTDLGGDGSVTNGPRAIAEIREPDGDVVRNKIVKRRVLSRRTAAIVNDLLRKTMDSGTAVRAALPNWPAAGKTGTTDDYGDAWFVGYTPQLVAAVWVGYPKALRPMLTEFHGEPVAGGTYPALIWKSFMERVLPFLGKEPVPFPPRPYVYATPRSVVHRDGGVQLDNGVCTGAVSVYYVEGAAPRKTANCLPNEVDVPDVVGSSLEAARERLASQPLTPTVVYRPAAAAQPVNIVLDQIPRKGRLSSYDNVTLVLAKPVYGVVPDVKGVTLRKARERLRKAGLRVAVVGSTDGPSGRVVAQAPASGVAAGRRMTVRLVVGRG